MLVPVIDVQSNNFMELWPAMVLAFKSSSFIAVDTELSGLGARKALLAESIEDRYKAISHAARTRSILSLGIACYKKLDGKADYTYLVQVYNLTLLCAEEYIIEPQSVQFLVQHGFDFNKQYAQGVAYNKGNDKGEVTHGINMRTLFVELLRANKPLVLHNGLIDLVFLYQCFYAHLPERLGSFTADLSQMFPAGIYDTKYAVEYELRFPASYLEYAYKKCKLDNGRSVESGQDERRVVLEFCNYSGQLQSYVDYRPCADSQNHGSAADICVQFSGYGWCPNGAQCPMSHDTDLIIRQDEKSKEDKRKKRKRKKRKKAGTEEEEEPKLPQEKKPHLEDVDEGMEEVVVNDNISMKCTDSSEQMNEDRERDDGKIQSSGVSDVPPASTEEVTAELSRNPVSRDSNKREVDTGTHRAGFDAFMTGFIFAFADLHSSSSEESQLWISDCENKLYLSGKSVPLHVAKSTFSKSSRAHVLKMEHVWGKHISNN